MDNTGYDFNQSDCAGVFGSVGFFPSLKAAAGLARMRTRNLQPLMNTPIFSHRRVLFGFVMALVGSVLPASAKTTLLLPLGDEPGWRDMAFLAAVPAAEMANASGASLVALQPDAGTGPEVRDYLRRYAPDAVYLVGMPEGAAMPAGIPGEVTHLPASSAETAALRLSQTFWEESTTVVVCDRDDYASALVAAPLAALLKAPVLYASASGISDATAAEMKRLGVTRVLAVGPDVRQPDAVRLAGAEDVMKWVKGQGIDVDYLAAVNPLDRSDSKVVKLSLIGAQLAAGRNGLVAPLAFEVEWKKPFKSAPPEGGLPAKFQGQEPPANSGVILAGAAEVPFILTHAGNRGKEALFLDLDGSGDFSGPFFWLSVRNA